MIWSVETSTSKALYTNYAEQFIVYLLKITCQLGFIFVTNKAKVPCSTANNRLS